MPGIDEAIVLKALSGVRDEERGGDLVSLGMVTGLRLKDGHVAFAIEVDPARECYPAGQGVGAIDSLVPAGELVRRFVAEAEEALGRVSALMTTA